MRITAQEEYGVRCILQLAKRTGGGPSTAHDIANAEGLSVPYVNKLLNVLKRAGLVESVRGVGGGFQLTRPAEQITLADVLEALDGVLFNLEFCDKFSGLEHACVHQNGLCGIRSVWTGITERVAVVLKQTTLAEIARDQAAALSEAVTRRFDQRAALGPV